MKTLNFGSPYPEKKGSFKPPLSRASPMKKHCTNKQGRAITKTSITSKLEFQKEPSSSNYKDGKNVQNWDNDNVTSKNEESLVFIHGGLQDEYDGQHKKLLEEKSKELS